VGRGIADRRMDGAADCDSGVAAHRRPCRAPATAPVSAGIDSARVGGWNGLTGVFPRAEWGESQVFAEHGATGRGRADGNEEAEDGSR